MKLKLKAPPTSSDIMHTNNVIMKIVILCKTFFDIFSYLSFYTRLYSDLCVVCANLLQTLSGGTMVQ